MVKNVFWPDLSQKVFSVDFQVELSFHTGDVITVYGEMDDDGFYMAKLRSHRGLVPSNFLTDAPHGTAGGVGGVCKEVWRYESPVTPKLGHAETVIIHLTVDSDH